MSERLYHRATSCTNSNNILRPTWHHYQAHMTSFVLLPHTPEWWYLPEKLPLVTVSSNAASTLGGSWRGTLRRCSGWHTFRRVGTPVQKHIHNHYLIQHTFSAWTYPTDRIAQTTAFVTPVVEHWLEWEIAQWVHHEGSIRQPIAPWANTLTTELHLTPYLEWT